MSSENSVSSNHVVLGGQSGGPVRSEIEALTVLLPKEPPEDADEQLRWLREQVLNELAIQVRRDGGLVFTVDGYDIAGQIGRAPLDPAQMDLRQVTKSFDAGRGYLALRCLRDRPPGDDPSPAGLLHALSRLASALVWQGLGVVLPQAGRLVRDRRAFLQLLGDLSEPSCVPFAAYIDWGLTESRTALRTFGMEVLGLPDVSVGISATGTGTWEWERGQEALLLACHTMVRAGHPLAEGARLGVPLGVQIGAYPLPAQSGDTEPYVVTIADGAPHLTRDAGEPDAATRWERASGEQPDPAEIGVNSYQALFRSSLNRVLPGALVAVLSPPDLPAGSPPHAVDVRACAGHGGYWVVTNGLGRVPQPGGTAEDGTAHVELLCWVEVHSPALASLMSSLAEAVHAHEGGGDTWKPGDTLTLPEPMLGVRHLLLSDEKQVPFPKGKPAHLLLLTPITEEEHGQIKDEGSVSFISEHVAVPERRELLARRWRLD